MNEHETETQTTATNPVVETTKKHADSLVDALVDVGAAWAAYGLKLGKMALETSALTLEKTAHALDTLATEFEKKAAPPQDAPRA